MGHLSANLAAMAAFLAIDDAADVDGQRFTLDGVASSTHPFGRMVV
jgi:hypothetical protein